MQTTAFPKTCIHLIKMYSARRLLNNSENVGGNTFCRRFYFVNFLSCFVSWEDILITFSYSIINLSCFLFSVIIWDANRQLMLQATLVAPVLWWLCHLCSFQLFLEDGSSSSWNYCIVENLHQHAKLNLCFHYFHHKIRQVIEIWVFVIQFSAQKSLKRNSPDILFEFWFFIRSRMIFCAHAYFYYWFAYVLHFSKTGFINRWNAQHLANHKMTYSCDFVFVVAWYCKLFYPRQDITKSVHWIIFCSPIINMSQSRAFCTSKGNISRLIALLSYCIIKCSLIYSTSTKKTFTVCNCLARPM